jgi:hypothetical protein
MKSIMLVAQVIRDQQGPTAKHAEVRLSVGYRDFGGRR